MKHSPVVMTQYALTRILKSFAARLGVEDSMADAMAQIHLQQYPTHQTWNLFMLKNCAGCVKGPENCEVFQPKEENCAGKATPQDVMTANALMIETGRWKTCPAYLPPNPA